MNLYLDNGSVPMPEFQLPDGFTAEMSRTNPFLTDEGSQSVPMTLPASEHNMKLIGWRYRFVNNKRYTKKLNAIMSEGVVWTKGTLTVNSANEKEGIDCTFYTNEGQLYEKIKDYKLEDLDWPELDGIGNDAETKAKYWMQKWADTLNGKEPQSEEYLFIGAHTDYTFNLKIEKEMEYKLLLNELSFDNGLVAFRGMEKIDYYSSAGEDATKITTPIGYGVTPFLRVGYVFKQIFQYFGYNLKESILNTDISFNKMVILNNTADAIVDGKLRFKQLLPTGLSVGDLIIALREKFSLVFVERGNDIYVKTWNDVLDAAPDTNLTISNTPSITFNDPQGFAIELDSLTEWGTFYYQQILKHEAPSGYEPVNAEIKDKTPTVELFPTAYMNQVLWIDAGAYAYVPDVGGIRHLNTLLSVDSQQKEEDNSDLSLAFCFATGLAEYTTNNHTYKYMAGSIREYDYNYIKWGNFNMLVNDVGIGNTMPGFDYTKNLYNYFWAKRDQMLQKANVQIICDSNIPIHKIIQMDITTPKIISGQKVLIERIDYVVGRPDLCQITARTLHLFPDETTT